MFEIAQEEIQVENVYQKRLILKNKHFKFGKGGLFCPPQINVSIQAVVQYLSGVFYLWMKVDFNWQSEQKLIIYWCLNEIYKHKTSVPEDFSKIMLPVLLDKNLFEPVIFITPDDKIYH